MKSPKIRRIKAASRSFGPLFAVLLLFALPPALSAQQKYALVIGNGAYTGITRLNNPVNDATDVSAALRGLGFTEPATSPAPVNMAWVEGGTFQMGSNNGDSDETPVHTVTVTSFSMGRTEVTQREWREIMGMTVAQQRDMANRNWPLYGEGDDYPIYYVSWNEAIEYCNKRSQKEGLTPAYRGSGDNITCDFNATGYRLPTEAEWEYAAKGGNKDAITYEYSGGNGVDAVAWYTGNSGGGTHPVGTKQPNSLGLYDMSGNVYEWCWDRDGGYSGGSQSDPRGASSGARRVIRGGNWNRDAFSVRSAYRSGSTPSGRYNALGFRLVRS